MASVKVMIAAIAFTTCLCACGTAAKIASTSTTVIHPSSGSTTSTTPGTTLPNPTVPSTTAPSTTAPSPTSVASTSTTLGGCAARAAETYIYVDSVAGNSAGGLTVTGNQATLVCGGLDDSHFTTVATTESATVLEGATIEVLQSPGSPQDVPIAANQFAGYLATDHDTRIFLVTGPLSAITGLVEQFHP